MNKNTVIFIACFLLLCLIAVIVTLKPLFVALNEASLPPNDLNLTRPYALTNSAWMEELTWVEIRDQISEGYLTVIVPTGGTEQNGPNVVTGKHNYIVSRISESIAQKLGHTLISPVIKNVPQGSLEPPRGHLRYPGTIGISEKAFKNVLLDVCRSLSLHGFKRIILIGDSGGNQKSLEYVASQLNKEFENIGAQVIYASDYYHQDSWSYDYLKELGYVQQPDVRSGQRGDIHTDLHYEAILATINPAFVHAENRLSNSQFEVNGVEFDSIDELNDLGLRLIEYRSDLVATQIQALTNENIFSVGEN